MQIKLIRIFLIIFITSISFSCSSTKKISTLGTVQQNDIIKDTTTQEFKLKLKKALVNYEFEGEITVNINNDEFNGNIEGSYIDKVRLLINVFGPFGIHFASIEVLQDTLKVANLWHKRYYQSKINISNNDIKLTLLDLVRKIILAEPLVDSLVLKSKKDTLYFQNTISKGIVEYNYIVSNNNLNFKKLNIDNLDIRLKYSKYKTINSNSYPMNIDFDINEPKMKIQFQLDELKELKEFGKYKPIDYNKLQKVDEINKLAK